MFLELDHQDSSAAYQKTFTKTRFMCCRGTCRLPRVWDARLFIVEGKDNSQLNIPVTTAQELFLFNNETLKERGQKDSRGIFCRAFGGDGDRWNSWRFTETFC